MKMSVRLDNLSSVRGDRQKLREKYKVVMDDSSGLEQ